LEDQHVRSYLQYEGGIEDTRQLYSECEVLLSRHIEEHGCRGGDTFCCVEVQYRRVADCLERDAEFTDLKGADGVVGKAVE
jgi:capsid portal protein